MGNDLSLKNLFGGLPFLDDFFQPTSFLTAVACARQFRYQKLGYDFNSLEHYLEPSNALLVYSRFLNKNIVLDGAPITPELYKKINIEIQHIIKYVPEWKPLLEIPLVIRFFNSDTIISSSSAAKPQHVFLTPKSLSSEDELREQILHEIVHIWTYMIEELWSLHQTNQSVCFILPSGVTNKTATGVLHAAYVAKVLASFYKKNQRLWEQRKIYLEDYCRKCLQQLDNFYGLTTVGEEIRQELEQ